MYQFGYDSVVLFACSVFCLAAMFLLMAINSKRFLKLNTNIFLLALILFTVGYFI